MISPAYADGSIIFKDNGNTLNYTNAKAGTAYYESDVWTVGSHSFTAVYNGSSSFTTSTSNSVGLTVSKGIYLLTLASPVIVLSSVTSSLVYSNPINFTVSISFSVPVTGTLMLMDTFNSTTKNLMNTTLTGNGAIFVVTSQIVFLFLY